MTLLAKSLRNGGSTLADHTHHVVEAMRTVGAALCPDAGSRALLLHGSILHDLGKGHPYFQLSLQPDFHRPAFGEVPHRHEISSLLFLPLFPRDEWDVLIDMVAAHHKSVRISDATANGHGLGLIDLVEDYGEDEVFQRHAGAWEEWHPRVFEILGAYRIATRPIPRSDACEAFEHAIRHVESARWGSNRWRGLLMIADHFASAAGEDTEERAQRLFTVPDLSPFERRAREAPATLFPLAKMRTDDPRLHSLVVAPTGAGKTDFLLRRCRSGRVFYLLPFQASINAMFLRLDATLNGVADGRLPRQRSTDIRRLHAASFVDIDGGFEEEHTLQRHAGAAIKVMTPHQLAALILGTSGHEAIALDVAGQDVILDEVHVYNEATQALVLWLVTALHRVGARLHVGSATIPRALETEVLRRLGGEECVFKVRLTEAELRTYDRHLVHKLPDEEAARRTITAAVRAGKRVLFLSNRIALAQERFEWLRTRFSSMPALLLHSRFRRIDRADLESRIGDMEHREGPCVVCATQVIEVSLDISFDTLVTDSAPLDSLIQRFGRVNRRRSEQCKTCPVYVIAPTANVGSALPYSLRALEHSWSQLPDGEVLEEHSLQSRIDEVYPAVDVQAIDTFLAVTPEGDMALPQLCHKPRSLLLEMLEIDSTSCICAADEGPYRRGPAEQRIGLEIPVSRKAIRPYYRQWTQIAEIGHRPFVVPDALYDPCLGLTLTDSPIESRII